MEVGGVGQVLAGPLTMATIYILYVYICICSNWIYHYFLGTDINVIEFQWFTVVARVI